MTYIKETYKNTALNFLKTFKTSPCVECITKAFCMNIIKDVDKFSCLHKLRTSCPIFREYIHYLDNKFIEKYGFLLDSEDILQFMFNCKER